MSQPTQPADAIQRAGLRTVFRRLKKILGFGRVSAVAARVDKLEPQVAQLEAMQQRIEEVGRQVEGLEAMYREQLGLQYLQLAARRTGFASDGSLRQ